MELYNYTANVSVGYNFYFAYHTTLSSNFWKFAIPGDDEPFNSPGFVMHDGNTTVDIALLWTYRPSLLYPQKSSVDFEGDLESLSFELGMLFENGDPVVQLFPVGTNNDIEYLLKHRPQFDCCSDKEVCDPRYYCLLGSLMGKRGLMDCLTEKGVLGGVSPWDCIIFLTSYSLSSREIAELSIPCEDDRFDLTASNWRESGIDTNLLTALHGGVDSQGIYWEGQRDNEVMMETLGRDFWNLRGQRCTLKDPCRPVLDCNAIGSFTAVALGRLKKPLPQAWVLLVSSALKNINQQLRNQYDELKDAIESLALDTFSIDEFYPKKNQNPALQNSLAGLSGIFSILGGFIPVAGPAISAAGEIISSVSTFLANSVPPDDPLVAQKTFSQQVLEIYRALLDGMEDAVTKLFNGESIPDNSPGSFNITDMMKGGAWVDPDILTNVSDLNTKVRVEILARSIDGLWKTWPNNKMWVLFVDLQDGAGMSACLQDTAGPPDSKYCGDGGVYYTYNFIENGHEEGGVSWPWGADQLQPKANISLNWVTEASAKSYQVSKRAGLDPFNFSQTAGTRSFLREAFNQPGENSDLSQYAGRYPGSWTLPVCDASTWGNSWNWDYAAPDSVFKEGPQTHPPCICGQKGLETYDWAQAAGLHGFETFWHRCNDALHDPDFTWPEGVSFVNYPANEGHKDYRVDKP